MSDTACPGAGQWCPLSGNVPERRPIPQENLLRAASSAVAELE